MIKIDDKEVVLSRFPDGTLHLTPELSNVEYDEPYKRGLLITWHYEGDEEMAAILFLVKHFQSLGYEINLDLPYIPNARQDRVKDLEKDVFTLKYFAEFINALKFNHVFVLDPHSNVSTALIDNVDVQTPREYIDATVESIYHDYELSKSLMAFYPDEGAMKRYSEDSQLEYTFAAKHRDWRTGKILGLEVIGNAESINGRDVLIIDDICSKGGTFYYAAKKLKELGANRIFLFVTHCEKTVFDGELFKSGLIEKLYTTDSIFTTKAQELAKSKGLDKKIEVFKIW